MSGEWTLQGQCGKPITEVQRRKQGSGMCAARWRLGVDLELGLDKKAPGEGEKGP